MPEHPPAHPVALGAAIAAFSTSRMSQKSAVFTLPVSLASTTPCDCLSCQTGRPDYPCLIEDAQ